MADQENQDRQQTPIEIQSVLLEINTIRNKVGSVNTNIENIVQNVFSGCAETLGILEKPELVYAMKPHLQKLIQIQNDATAYRQALSSIRPGGQPGYNPTAENPTDFEGLINERKQQHLNRIQRNQRVEDHEYYARILQAAGIDADGSGEGQDQQQEDDDIVIETGKNVAPNAKCPLTGIDIFELDNPVEDSKGYVYQSEAIIKAISQQREKQLKCPVAGTSHFIRENTLKRANKVIFEQKKRRLGRNQNDQNAGEGTSGTT
eukprot:TRINITY_DN4639_c2_g5_i1.p1 TRINITY_DN4639_c2_g5~~TRINITY_DN4639_c2_g5_i1.p1  ORF type:complete len:262 (-),score=42.84 TRINITY_DN4639_c2_g5_i1:277-1062(-)